MVVDPNNNNIINADDHDENSFEFNRIVNSDSGYKFDMLSFSNVSYELIGVLVEIHDFKMKEDEPEIHHAFAITRCKEKFWVFDNVYSDKVKQVSNSRYTIKNTLESRSTLPQLREGYDRMIDIEVRLPSTAFYSGLYTEINLNEDDLLFPMTQNTNPLFSLIYHIRPHNTVITGGHHFTNKYKSNKQAYKML